MNTYILGKEKIVTTEERYNAVFKEMGYVPFVEKKAEKPVKKETKETEKVELEQPKEEVEE